MNASGGWKSFWSLLLCSLVTCHLHGGKTNEKITPGHAHRTFVSMAEASWTPQSRGWLQRSQQAKHTLRENSPIVKNAIPNLETNKKKMQKSHLREHRTNPSWAANHGATFFYFRSAWSEIAGCFLNVCRLQVLWYSIKPTTQKVWD